ncbi:uncharacterized protein [Parasteatoda tepidariorum]|uniref:uncharacterized protein n=1 Tax=Parasteatoda tepidariorum TaxID=114398 RepID=UPI0039BD7077
MTTENSEKIEATIVMDAEANKVSIKIPPFWREKPDIWFYQVEAQFQINKITTEETKFNYLISQLEPKYVENIWDIIKDTKPNKYTLAKERLLNTFKESENKRIQRLVTGLELGDYKPSQLLQKMKNLGADDFSEKVLKSLWLDKMPNFIRNILLVSEESLDKLSTMADKIHEMKTGEEICTVSPNVTYNDALIARIAALEQKIDSLQINDRSRSKFRNNYRNTSRSRSHSIKAFNRNDFAADSAAEEINDSRKFRLYVRGRNTGINFLIDSGADVSLLPLPANKSYQSASDYKLYAANGSEITTYGIKVLTVDLGLRRSFNFPFIITKINKGIIGADFLNKFNLLIDIKEKRLIDGVTNLIVKGEISPICMTETISIMDKNSKFSELFSSYPNLTKPNLLISDTKHEIRHFIATTGKPVFSKARQLDPKKLKIAKEEFQFMLGNGIIRSSKSPWASPLHMVKKKDGSYRPCGDYRRLNDQTIRDRYPIPRIEDFHHILKDAKVFSKFDLFKAYYQLPINEEEKQKTAIITPFGLFEFNVMSFGLRNAPSTFQRFINEVLCGLDFVFPYLDNILVASRNKEEHQSHLKQLFDKLDKYGLRINISKSVIAVEKLEFLGYEISSEGSKPLSQKVEAIHNYKLPETIRELRTFPGLINYYRRYIKDAAKTQAILHEYLKGAHKNDERKIMWTEQAIDMFEKCKQDLSNVALLTYPKFELPLCLCSDASDFAIGSFGEYQQPDERFNEIHIDLIGPLPPSNGNKYCLTCIDRFTSWIEVVPIPDIKAETVARCFYENWIVRFGVPYRVITDRGSQFDSETFKSLTNLCGVKINRTTAYHPQCNGKIERQHRTLKTAIKAHNSIKWSETLLTVLLGLRAALRDDTNYSISQMVYGKCIKLPGEFFDNSKVTTSTENFISNLQNQMETLKPLESKYFKRNKVFVHKDLSSCSHVFMRIDRVRKPLESPYQGPYKVMDKSEKYFVISYKGKNVSISIDRLKPAYLLNSENENPDYDENLKAAKPNECLTSNKLQENAANSEQNVKMSRFGRKIKKPVRFLEQNCIN